MAWNFLASLLFYAGTFIVSALLDRRDAPENKPGEPQFPTADPQKPIPVVYGTTRVGMNVTYKAGLTRGENTVRTGALTFGWQKQKIGDFYYLDVEAVICHGPVNHLHDIIVDGTKSLAAIGPVVRTAFENIGGGITYTTAAAISPDPLTLYFGNVARETTPITITAGDLLGGKLSRGGIGAGGDTGSIGLMRFHPGGNFIEPNTRLETLYGGPLPNYPNLCRVVFEDNFYFGNSEQLPSVEFVLSRRAPNVPFGGTGFIGNVTANAGTDAIAACVLWDLLTNTTYGLGLPVEELDQTSFSYLSGFDIGVSFTLSEQTTGKAVIADLLRTLDGVLYTDPHTGLLCVRLLQAPDASMYGSGVVGSGITLDASNISDIVWTESAPDAQANEIKVEFIDRARNYTKNSVTVRNVAAIQALGRVESRTVSFLGCQSADVANRLGTRELRSRSAVLGHASITTDRTAYTLTPAQTFTLDYDIAGQTSRTMRVVSVKDSPAGQVIVEAVEDIYSTPAPSFAVEETPEPVPPPAYPTLAPYVREDVTVAGAVGTLLLYVYDPTGVVTLVEFQTTSGTGTPSGYASDAYPYTTTVALDPYADSSIDYRVTYTDANGDAATIERTVVFPVDGATAEANAGEVLDAAEQLVNAVIGIPVVFIHAHGGVESLTTIPTAAAEVTGFRRKRYLVGAGSARLRAIVENVTGTPTLGVQASADDFATAGVSITTLPITGDGTFDTDWVDMPAGTNIDGYFRPTALDGADTDACDVRYFAMEVRPALVTAFRDYSDDFSDDFS